MSCTAFLTCLSISSLLISIPFGSLYSPAIIVLLVETIVSQATLASGNFANIKSTTVSDILSQILSGCPSETDSDVNRKSFNIAFLSLKIKYKEIYKD